MPTIACRPFELRLVVAVVIGCLLAGAAQALPTPEGRVILTVDGLVDTTNHEGRSARFDRAMLEALGLQTITTETAWTDGPVVFEGVPLAAVLKAVGARGTELLAIAINDYEATLPTTDATLNGALLAMRMDGKVMSVRNRGPLWLVYPWSDRPELATPLHRARAVWQLKRLVVR